VGCLEPVKCPFCNPVADEIAAKNNLWYARWNRCLVSEGHLLVIPFRHTPDFFSMTVEENQAVPALVEK
jgi:diadenosine tetraphosphate (Ap4A) HIT family hydrolase